MYVYMYVYINTCIQYFCIYVCMNLCIYNIYNVCRFVCLCMLCYHLMIARRGSTIIPFRLFICIIVRINVCTTFVCMWLYSIRILLTLLTASFHLYIIGKGTLICSRGWRYRRCGADIVRGAEPHQLWGLGKYNDDGITNLPYMYSTYDRIPSPVLSTYICFHQSRSRDNYGTKPAIHLPAYITFGGGDCSCPTIQPCSCPPTPPVPLWPSLVCRMHTLAHDYQWVCMYVCMPACVEACMYTKAGIAAFLLL